MKTFDLTEDETNVLIHMSCGEIVYPIKQVAADAQVPFKRAREIIRSFHDRGIAEFGYLQLLDEHLLAGKGYWLTAQGLEMREQAEMA